MYRLMTWLRSGYRRTTLAPIGTRRPKRANKPSMHLEALEDRSVPAGGLVGNLVVFGDSLSDVGNLSLATGGQIPLAGVYQLGRFSGGPVWVDSLAEYLGEPALVPSLAGGLNFAFGGATVALTDPSGQIPSLGQQVGQYLTGLGLPGGTPHVPRANDLFVVWAGANDFFDSFTSPTGPIDPRLTAAGLVGSLDLLAQHGGKHFVVNNLPPLGHTPLFLGLGIPPLSAGADLWAAGFNAALDAGLTQFRAAHPGVTIDAVDVDALFAQVTSPANPFGFSNITDPVGDYTAPGASSIKNVTVADPSSYLFFDGIHPGTKAHQIVGLQAASEVYTSLNVHRITVGNTSDQVDPLSGSISLREAVNLANQLPGRDTITFDLGRGSHEITLAGTQLVITDDLTIDGPGRNRLTVSGDDASRVFLIDGGTTDVAIDDLTLANGRATGTGQVLGGAVLNNGGQLALRRVTFTENVAAAPGLGELAAGGAIASVGPTARLSLDEVTFGGNRAEGFLTAGGAVATILGATTDVTHSSFTSNQSNGLFLSVGGAIYADGAATLNVGRSQFNANQATALLSFQLIGNLIQGAGVGGAIASGGGSHTRVSHSSFVGNLARGGGGGPGQDGSVALAGAVYSTNNSLLGPIATGASLDVDHSSFTANQSRGGDGGDGGDGQNGGAAGQGSGGAIHNELGSVASVVDSLFIGNQALAGTGGNGGSNGNGGGRNPFVSNSGLGGAINNLSAVLSVDHATFIGNLARGAKGGNGGTGGQGGTGGNAYGGGINNSAQLFTPNAPPLLRVEASTFVANQAVGGAGGNGGSGGNAGAGGIARGGAISNADVGTLTLVHSWLLSNQALGGTGGNQGQGGLGGNGGDGLGGGLFNGLGAASSLEHVTMVANWAAGGAGGAGGNGGNGHGGGVNNDASSSLLLSYSRVLANRATGGSAGLGGVTGEGVGGGLYLAAGGVARLGGRTRVFANFASTSDDDVFGVFFPV